ncbi:MAG TPA: OB-fold domain-containing protein [Candidatus Acidoferrales bacterium]|nr:OB-fold domain-containing protein [Candidatus Acidoferrales bacterium]
MTQLVPTTAPLSQRQKMEFPYKHSTGPTVGRFYAGLKEQKKIWGQRVSGQGVVVPPLGYSEIDASEGGDWVEVSDSGTLTAVAMVHHPLEDLHPSTKPFAFVLVKLDGADTALPHIVTENPEKAKVGARVQAVWAADDQRTGTLRDIVTLRTIKQ